MGWVETPSGCWLNLSRASRITIEPSSHNSGEWAVLAHYPRGRNWVGSFPSRTAAGEYVADLLFGANR